MAMSALRPKIAAPASLALFGCVALLGSIGLGATGCSTPPSPSLKKALANQVERPKGSSSAPTIRALWLWSERPDARAILENADGSRDELLAFLRAPHGQPAHAVNRLLFEAREHADTDRLSKLREVTYDPLGDEAEQSALRVFLRLAHEQGVAVEYLDGQAIWLASDKNARTPVQICRDVAAFNLASDDSAARFDGVHFDIEPHTVTKGPHAGVWWKDRLPDGYNRAWTARWKEILNTCRESLDAYEDKTGHHLTLAVDVGADFAHYNKPMQAFLDGPDAPVDYVTVMNYYDNRPNRDDQPSFFHGASDGNGIVGGVEENLELWRHTPVVFGVETGPTQIAPDPRSFHQEGYIALYETLDALLSRYGAANCAGVAIHHYAPEAYRDLQP